MTDTAPATRRFVRSAKPDPTQRSFEDRMKLWHIESDSPGIDLMVRGHGGAGRVLRRRTP
jgi:hypothetical protein